MDIFLNANHLCCNRKMNAQQKYVERSKKMKKEYKEGFISDETFLDKELLFDDWEVRNPTIYSRERKKYVIFLLCHSVLKTDIWIVNNIFFQQLFYASYHNPFYQLKEFLNQSSQLLVIKR